ncbi:erythromycin esterase family protein [Phytoactinopolyspora endophytica]|uniref:erythromycin esterase family protein n=1 Tax=Phytoactinopolyspora endophytica TaxID=1642495 RepID=UPI00101B73A0|nr:erythromycin esterase family protein [Phytoactinopolyspora endophytica]
MPPLSRRSLLVALSGAGLALSTTATPASANQTPTLIDALTRASHPLRTTSPRGNLRDLHPLGAAIGNTPVVALGEVAHGARELFTLKHRVFRYLVLEKGFTTFALETSWTSGLRLSDYVRHGTGDPRGIMAEEFGGGAWPWGVREYLDLIEWMRDHNRRHPETQVQFMGNDLAHPYIPGTLFDDVINYVAEHYPALRHRFVELYRDLKAHATTDEFSALPQPRRRRIAALARRAERLLAAQPPGADRATHDWTAQHARVIAQTATLLAFDLEDPTEIPDAMRYRDELMARNTIWWHHHTGHKILLSAHNGHTAYQTYDPENYPVIQGTYIRDLLGADYLSIGTTLGAGAATTPDGEDGDWEVRRFDPPREGSSEHTLNRLPHAYYLLDMRATPQPAHEWLRERRPTRDIGPPGDPYRPYTLANGHDLLIHLRQLRPANPLPGI